MSAAADSDARTIVVVVIDVVIGVNVQGTAEELQHHRCAGRVHEAVRDGVCADGVVDRTSPEHDHRVRSAVHAVTQAVDDAAVRKWHRPPVS